MRFDFVTEDEGFAPPFCDPQLAEIAQTVAGLIRGRFGERLAVDAEVAVLLTRADGMRDLNARFRGQDKPTDVLSFPADDESGAFLGDLALCPEVIAGDAVTLTRDLVHHLTHILLHGVLHLLGFDHEAEDDAAEMEGLECELLASIGLPDPYSANPAT